MAKQPKYTADHLSDARKVLVKAAEAVPERIEGPLYQQLNNDLMIVMDELLAVRTRLNEAVR